MTTLVTDLTKDFVSSASDFDRSATAGGIVVVLLIALLIEREIVANTARNESRALTAFAVPLLYVFVVLVLVRVDVLAR